MKTKKVTRLIFSVITAMALTLVTAVCVSAGNIFDSSKKISTGKTYSTEFEKSSDEFFYTFSVESKGTLKVSVTSYINEVWVYLYDKDGAKVEPDDIAIKSGKLGGRDAKTKNFLKKDSGTGVFKGTLSYSVKPGTYYLKLDRYSNYDYGKVSFSVTAPKSSSSSGSDKETASIKLNLSVGDKIDVSAMNGGKEVSGVKWTSTDTKVAKVSSKGIITAVGEGSCKITWKNASSSFTIYITVE